MVGPGVFSKGLSFQVLGCDEKSKIVGDFCDGEGN